MFTQPVRKMPEQKNQMSAMTLWIILILRPHELRLRAGNTRDHQVGRRTAFTLPAQLDFAFSLEGFPHDFSPQAFPGKLQPTFISVRSFL